MMMIVISKVLFITKAVYPNSIERANGFYLSVLFIGLHTLMNTHTHTNTEAHTHAHTHTYTHTHTHKDVHTHLALMTKFIRPGFEAKSYTHAN